MSFLTGSTKENAPKDIIALRKQLEQYVQQHLGGQNQAAGMAPFQKMFADRRAFALAQAKESAGNLTGSGLGNVIGTAAGRSASEENSFLAQLLENRFNAALQGVGNLKGEMAHQPGFLEYAAQGVGMAAPFFL